jgi:glutaredoxin
MVKVYLSQKGVPFKERNISLDPEAKQAVLDMGFRTTPVTMIAGHKVVGYNPLKLDAALDEANG